MANRPRCEEAAPASSGRFPAHGLGQLIAALERSTDLGVCQTVPNPRNYTYLSKDIGAVEKTRTSKGFRPQRPQRCAFTSSAMTAHSENPPAWAGGRLVRGL